MTIRMNRFVVYEPTTVVALDLEGCLREHDPGAAIILAATLAEAMRIIAEGSVTLAVLHVATVEGTPEGVPLLLIGQAAEECRGRWPVLRGPFSADDVATALTGLGVRPGHAPV